MTEDGRVTVWFNGRCSTCRRLRQLLEERGVAARYRHYLDDPPSAAELRRVLALLPAADAARLVRMKESPARELGLADAAPEAVAEALARHPSLIERPVVIAGDRAMVARPPERVLELLTPG